MKVLIFIAEASFERVVTVAATYSHAEVRICHTQDEALDISAKWRPDILILDASSAPLESVAEASAYCACISFVATQIE